MSLLLEEKLAGFRQNPRAKDVLQIGIPFDDVKKFKGADKDKFNRIYDSAENFMKNYREVGNAAKEMVEAEGMPSSFYPEFDPKYLNYIVAFPNVPRKQRKAANAKLQEIVKNRANPYFNVKIGKKAKKGATQILEEKVVGSRPNPKAKDVLQIGVPYDDVKKFGDIDKADYNYMYDGFEDFTKKYREIGNAGNKMLEVNRTFYPEFKPKYLNYIVAFPNVPRKQRKAANAKLQEIVKNRANPNFNVKIGKKAKKGAIQI